MRFYRILNYGNGAMNATTASVIGSFIDFKGTKIPCCIKVFQRLRQRAPIRVGAWDRRWTLARRVRQLVPMSPDPQYHMEVGLKPVKGSKPMPAPQADR